MSVYAELSKSCTSIQNLRLHPPQLSELILIHSSKHSLFDTFKIIAWPGYKIVVGQDILSIFFPLGFQVHRTRENLLSSELSLKTLIKWYKLVIVLNFSNSGLIRHESVSIDSFLDPVSKHICSVNVQKYWFTNKIMESLLKPMHDNILFVV